MEFALFLLKPVVAALISVATTLVFSENIKNWLSPLLAKFGSKSDASINGLWIATFRFGPDDKSYSEAIEIKSFFGMMVGHLVPHDDNHDGAKLVENNKPLRVRGNMKDNFFFTCV